MENSHYKKILVLFIFLLFVFARATVLAEDTATITPTVTEATQSTEETTPTPTLEETEEATPTPTVSTEEYSSTLAEKNISAVITIDTQYPWSKKIPIKLSITPRVSGQKIQVKWQKRLGFFTKPSTYTISNPQAGTTYTKSLLLEPRASGKQRATADIILTTSANNYVISKDLILTLDKKLVVIPKTPEYVMYTTVMYALLIIVLLILLPFGLYRGFIYVKKYIFPKWLEAKTSKPI